MTTALHALDRAWPIVVFLLSVTVVAELSDRAGVFETAARWMARRGRHRTWVLWLLFSLFAVTCTVFLSLDTTAVLLTPVGLAIARQIGVPHRPFALTTLWIANTGSLLLSVSNLTNLLALSRFDALGVSHGAYVRLALLPGLAAIVVTLSLILALHPAVLTSSYALQPSETTHDRQLLIAASLICLAIGPAFAAGLPAWAVAGVAAVALLAVTLVRERTLLRGLRLPWLIALGFSVLAVTVAVVQESGGLDWLGTVVGRGTGLPDLLRITGVTALAANVINNLPAYLAVEHVVSDQPVRLMAALIGANLGPLVTPWASLATLLWLQRWRATGVRWRLHRLGLAGLGCALAAMLAAVLTLWLTGAR